MSLVSFFEGKKVVITGGCGSVGKELLSFLQSTDCAEIRILDINEDGVFQTTREQASDERVHAEVCDIRNSEALTQSFWGCDYVFHLAAAKHVSLSESKPLEAVSTNILGTQSVINAALNASIKRCIFTSTDKAVNPTNAMGATKLVAEKLIAANAADNRFQTIFSSTRFGNVLGSSGSVVRIILEQILNKKPITITDPAMTRYVMSAAESVRLICAALRLSCGGEIFVPKMPVVRIGELVDAIISVVCKEGVISEGQIPSVKIVGPRLGERMDEELMSRDESERALELDDLYLIPSLFDKLDRDFSVAKFCPEMSGGSRHKHGVGGMTLLSGEALENLLRSSGCISDVLSSKKKCG